MDLSPPSPSAARYLRRHCHELLRRLRRARVGSGAVQLLQVARAGPHVASVAGTSDGDSELLAVLAA